MTTPGNVVGRHNFFLKPIPSMNTTVSIYKSLYHQRAIPCCGVCSIQNSLNLNIEAKDAGGMTTAQTVTLEV